jgi:hypothetical protein
MPFKKLTSFYHSCASRNHPLSFWIPYQAQNDNQAQKVSGFRIKCGMTEMGMSFMQK